MVHDLDLALWYLPAPVQRVYAQSAVSGAADVRRAGRPRRHAHRRGRLAGDPPVDVAGAGRRADQPAGTARVRPFELWGTIDGRLDLVGTAQTGRVNVLGDGLSVWSDEHHRAPDVSLWPEVHGRVTGALREELAHWLDCVRAGTPLADRAARGRCDRGAPGRGDRALGRQRHAGRRGSRMSGIALTPGGLARRQRADRHRDLAPGRLQRLPDRRRRRARPGRRRHRPRHRRDPGQRRRARPRSRPHPPRLPHPCARRPRRRRRRPARAARRRRVPGGRGAGRARGGRRGGARARRRPPQRLLPRGLPARRAATSTTAARDGDRLRCGRLELQVLATPGHSAGSVCLVLEGARGPRPVRRRHRLRRRQDQPAVIPGIDLLALAGSVAPAGGRPARRAAAGAWPVPAARRARAHRARAPRVRVDGPSAQILQ